MKKNREIDPQEDVTQSETEKTETVRPVISELSDSPSSEDSPDTGIPEEVSEDEVAQDTESQVEENKTPEEPESFDLRPTRIPAPQAVSDEPAEEPESAPSEAQPEDTTETTEITPESAPAPKPQRKRTSNGLLAAIKQSLISEFKPLSATDRSPAGQRRQMVLTYRRQRGAAGTLLLLHALLVILLMIVWAILPRQTFGVDRMALDGGLFSTLLTQGISVLLPAVFVMFLYNMDLNLINGRKSQSLSVYGLAALIGIPAAIAFSGLNNITLFILTRLGFHPVSESLLGQIPNPSVLSYILLIMVTALIPAICEELMFRGVIQTSLSLSGRRGLSIFLMATGFALYHNDPYFILAPFFAGLYLGVIRLKSDNLYTTILTHFVMNSTLVLIQPILPLFTSSMSFAGTAGRTSLYASLIAAAVALVTLIPLTSALFTYCGKEKAPSDPIYRRLQQEQWFPADWKYMLALIILFITMLVLRS